MMEIGQIKDHHHEKVMLAFTQLQKTEEAMPSQSNLSTDPTACLYNTTS
jgi:hypothetical protein